MLQGWNKSQEAFTQLYRRFSKPVLFYVRSKIHDPEVAEELSQEVFLKAFRFRDSYRDRYAVSTWLWTIARNTVADHLRAHRAELAAQACDRGMDVGDIPCGRLTAEGLCLKRSERRNYLKMMKSLTRLQKRVIWMRWVHHLSYEEISKKLGISLSAVKNLAYRAKNSLREFAAISSSPSLP